MTKILKHICSGSGSRDRLVLPLRISPTDTTSGAATTVSRSLVVQTIYYAQGRLQEIRRERLVQENTKG
jgi:hypothetical protein